MIDHGLDLAIIGNGLLDVHSKALLAPARQIVRDDIGPRVRHLRARECFHIVAHACVVLEREHADHAPTRKG